MKMTFRWYGSQMDPIPLRYIKQIPNMSGVVSSLMDMPAGALWPTERIRTLKQEVNDAGLELEVIESVNIHEDIKLGLPSRDEYIDNYRQTVARLGQAGVKVICYNFMPVFDWTRTDLAKPRFDGATVLAYDQSIIDRITDPQAFADRIQQGAGDFEMAGWEPERMAELKKLFAQYASVSHEDLFRNLQYFLKAVIPVCEQYDVKLAIHPDDPPWDIFGLPRICTISDDRNNGIIFFFQFPCTHIADACGNRGRAVAGVEYIAVTLAPLRESADAAFPAQRFKPVFPPSQNLVRVGLVSHIPDQLVFWKIEDAVHCNRQFHDTKIGRQMAAGFTQRLDNKFPDFLCKRRKLVRRNLLDIVWFLYFF